MNIRILLVACGIGLAACESAAVVFPEPQEMKQTSGAFRFDAESVIILPPSASAADRRLAAILSREFTDFHGVAVQSAMAAELPREGRAILMGSLANPLVRAEVARAGIALSSASPGPEGYVLRVTPTLVLVAGVDDAGAYYGVQTLRQLIRTEGQSCAVSGVEIRDWPVKPFRGIKVLLPGPDNLGFFRRFITDFAGLYKFNRLIIQVNAGMRLTRHPELNAGEIEMPRDLNASRRDRPTGPRGEKQDATHHDLGDGRILEQDEVADIVRWAAENHIEVIPEIPSLSHCYFLLTRHREFADVPTAEWPDTYCPSNPGSYKLLFEVMDEYLEVMRPKMVNIGHDEWRSPVDLCPLCKDKDHTELFVQDIARIYDYLSQRKIRTAIWGDHLIEPLRGKAYRMAGKGPQKYRTPGAISDRQTRDKIPKDILIFNWFWNDAFTPTEETAKSGKGESTDISIVNWGFEQVFGNFTGGMQNYERRRSRPGVLGGAASCWSASTEFGLGKDAVYEILSTAPMLWSTPQVSPDVLPGLIQSLLPDVRRRLSGTALPSSFGDPIRVIEVAATGNAAVTVGEDPSSLVFVQKVSKPGMSTQVAQIVYNADDTAGILGFYEVEYDDGLVLTVPIRYGWNILERDWLTHHHNGGGAYAAELVNSGEGAAFAYEWPNPRLGKQVKQVRLRSLVADNPVTLAQLRVVAKRAFPEPVIAR